MVPAQNIYYDYSQPTCALYCTRVIIMTSWRGYDFRITGPLGNPPVTEGFPSQRANHAGFYLFAFWSLTRTSCWNNSRVAGDLRRLDVHVTSLLLVNLTWNLDSGDMGLANGTPCQRLTFLPVWSWNVCPSSSPYCVFMMRVFRACAATRTRLNSSTARNILAAKWEC